MAQPTLSNVPLLGALCVASDLISEADLDACLALQQTKYRGTPIGQILVIEGYLSQPDLARMVARQQSFRRTFCKSLEDSFARSVGEQVAATHSPQATSQTALPELDPFAAAELDNSPLFGASR